MPVSGPSKEFAIIKSQEAYEEIMQLLNDKYHIGRPSDNMGLGIEKKWQADWDQDANKLREALTELFWTSDCASF